MRIQLNNDTIKFDEIEDEICVECIFDMEMQLENKIHNAYLIMTNDEVIHLLTEIIRQLTC